jgi:hypothetical protein
MEHAQLQPDRTALATAGIISSKKIIHHLEKKTQV